MKRIAALLLLTLTGCRGCENGATAPLAARSIGEDLEVDAGPRPRPLSPEELEGVFPPRWGIGDTWFLRTNIPNPFWFPGEPRHGQYAFRFQVMDVPREGHEYYRVESEGKGPNGVEHSFFVFRVPDYSVIASMGSMPPSDQISSFAHHLHNGGEVLGFPIAPPLLDTNPPRFANPLREQVLGEDGDDLDSTVQTMEPTPAGLRITQEVTQLFSVLRIVMEWRRSDPWWSSVRVYARHRDDDKPDAAGDEVLVDFADLLQPGDEPPSPLADPPHPEPQR